MKEMEIKLMPRSVRFNKAQELAFIELEKDGYNISQLLRMAVDKVIAEKLGNTKQQTI